MQKLIIQIMLLLIFVATAANAANAATSPAPIPQTGQTSCYDTAGTSISCASTGQDGDLLYGVKWPTPRFTANTDQTVTDNLTGLIWSKDANPAGATKTWQEALDYIKTLNSQNYLGHNDWRLPNVNELRSLGNGQPSNLATWLNTQGFSNVQPFFYWSSTSDAYSSASAWVVDMYSGGVYSRNKTNNYYVWPVRSGQSGLSGSLVILKTGQTTCSDASGATISCTGTGQDGELQTGAVSPTPRFSANTDQTVSDNLTGLVWSKDGNPAAGYKTWQGALDYIKTLNSSNYLGHNDWRLPNRDELASLVNYKSQSTPATWLNSQGFSGVQSSYIYWSSTSYASNSTYAWFVAMGYGGVNYDYKTDNWYVWPVRSGQWLSGSLVISSYTTTFTSTNITTTSPPTVLTLTNSAAGSAQISGITITGTDANQFKVATGGTNPCTSLTPTLASNTSCTLNVTFAPTTVGAKTATLQINSNDATNPVIKNDLTGTGVEPINGACGTSNKQTVTAKPTTNLCSSGTASAVTGTNSYSWTCDGANGGTSATCSATPDSISPTVKIIAPVNGTRSDILWQIDGTAADNTIVSKVEIQIYNGLRYVTSTGSWSTTAGWIPAVSTDSYKTWTLDTSNFAMNTINGTYTITARSTDILGNLSTLSTVSFIRTSGGGTVTTKPGDCDNSGTVTIAEVQSAINMFLGLKAADICVDIDNNKTVTIAEVQKVINSFLGL